MMNLYDNEENAVVNHEPEESETPATLVGHEGEGLSPNPAGFGFTKQEIVDALPGSGEPNVLYLVKVYDKGVLVGYKAYRYSKEKLAFTFVYNTNIPNLEAENKGTQKPVDVNNAPKLSFIQIFNGNVSVNGLLYINGKELKKYIDDNGGVTEEELNLAIAAAIEQVNADKVVFVEVTDITNISGTILSALRCGDVVLKVDNTGKHAYVVSFKKDGTGICLTYCDATYVETVSYDYSGGSWVYNSIDNGRITNTWYGTQDQYDALSPNYDANTIYYIREE